MPTPVLQLIADLKCEFGTKVYPVAGEQQAGIVTGFLFRPGHILYYVSWAPGKESCHYDFELSCEKQTEDVQA